MFCCVLFLFAFAVQAKPPEPVMPSGPGPAGGPPAVVVIVKGMVCSFCVQGIEKMLRDLPSVKDLAINLDDRKVSLWTNGLPPTDVQLQKTVRDAGYEVEKIYREPGSSKKAQKP